MLEIGLDPAQYGSCSEPDQRSIKNKGRVWINRGCGKWYDCPWKDNTQHMVARDATDTNPRPRHVRSKFIKPNSGGTGDRVIMSYCACYQFLGDMKRRDGKNNEIAEVTGGEGEVVSVRSSERTVKPDGGVYYKPVAKDVTIPRFPDPTEVDELFEDVFAARGRQEHKALTEDSERASRLGARIAPPSRHSDSPMDIVEIKDEAGGRSRGG